MTTPPLTVSTAELVAQIHAAARPLVIVVTGGGSRALADLLTVPGASRTVLEARVPYGAAALVEWLGGRPDQFCSEATARAMAMRGFLRASELLLRDGDTQRQPTGVACTASLASDREKRGPHRAFLAQQTADETMATSVPLVAGRRDRQGEEAVVADELLNVVARAAGVALRLEIARNSDEATVTRRAIALPSWRSLVLGESSCCAAGPVTPRERGQGRAIFPGAFHPRHAGHREMVDVAERLLGMPIEHEISLVNVDKPSLDYLEIEERFKQYRDDEGVWLTRAATFVEKARLFPGATFIVGADTVVRIGDPRYYGDDAAAMSAAIEELARAGVRFLVFGRVAQGQFESLDALSLPGALRALCQGVPESMFRRDVSSTELRHEVESSRDSER